MTAPILYWLCHDHQRVLGICDEACPDCEAAWGDCGPEAAPNWPYCAEVND